MYFNYYTAFFNYTAGGKILLSLIFCPSSNSVLPSPVKVFSIFSVARRSKLFIVCAFSRRTNVGELERKIPLFKVRIRA